MRHVLRLAALGFLVATLTLAATAGARAHDSAPSRTGRQAGLISSIKSALCPFLDDVETVELPVSLGKFVASGGTELEASTVLLFGANKALCGGGRAEKLFSLAHDWLLGALAHDLKLSNGFDFSSFKLKLPHLVSKLSSVPALQIASVGAPRFEFSRNPVGTDNLVPVTVNWLARPLVGDVLLQAVSLSGGRTFAWRVSQRGLVGSQTVPLGLSAGRWQLCVRPDTVFRSNSACGYPFWVTICSGRARSLNSQLAASASAGVSFYGYEAGVVVQSAYGTATFDVDRRLGTYFRSSFNLHDPYGHDERFFAYWAWNLGEGWHTLDAYSPHGTFGSAVAGHVLDVVTLSTAPWPVSGPC